MVYKNEINNIFIPELVNANLKAQRISLEKIKEIVAKELNNYEMVGINIDANPKKCDKIWLIEHNDSQKEWKFIYFDAFSGKIKSELLAHDEGFFGVLTKLHESLFLGKSGHVILTLTAIFTFFICISGFWWEFQIVRMPEFKNDFVIDAKIYNKNLSLDELVARSKNDLAGFEPHFISLPFMQGANIRLFGYVKDQNFLHNEYSSILTYR